MQEYARRLRRERELLSWSQEQVAEKIGTTAPNVSRWERGKTFPDTYYRQKLCELFSKNIEELGLIQNDVDEKRERSPIQRAVAQDSNPPVLKASFSTPQTHPSDLKPVTLWQDRDEALYNMTRRIHLVINDMLGLLQTNSNDMQDDHIISDVKHEGKSLPFFDAFHMSQISSSLSDIPVTEIVNTHPDINPLSQQPHSSYPTLLQPPREVMTDQLQSGLPETTVLSSDTSIPFSSSSFHLGHPPHTVSSNDLCPPMSTVSTPHVAGSVPTKRTDRLSRFSRDKLFLSVALALFLTLSIENLVLRFPTTVNIYKNFIISGIPAVPSHTTATSAAVNAYNTDTTTNGIMFGFNAAHTNWNSYEKILSTTNVSSLRPNWLYPTGSTGSSPAITNGMIYIGSNNHKIYAFNALCRTACQPLWSYFIGRIVGSSPAVANGVVYIGSDKLYAYGLPQ